MNLLKNAFEAAEPNNTVSLHAYLEDGKVVVKIQDTGCGISEDQLPTIFEPFVTYKKNGTGLGLAITRNIILMHRGTITVSSVLDEGTTFTVKIPLTYIRQEG